MSVKPIGHTRIIMYFDFFRNIIQLPEFKMVRNLRAAGKRRFHYIHEFSANILNGVKHAAKRFTVGIGVALAILWTSVLLYATFYKFYVPSPSLVKPAHFKFRVCPSGAGMCSFPAANITLGSDSNIEVLGRGQYYRVLLVLHVPDSDVNRHTGMIMVTGRTYDRYGSIGQESSRAVSVKYKSELLATIQTLVLAPFYITGLAEQTQTMSIELFEEFWDDYYKPAAGVLLEIHSRQLLFYSAELQFHTCYSGLRYYLFYYPLTCATCGILFNYLWLALAVTFTWYRFGLRILELEYKPISDTDQDNTCWNSHREHGDEGSSESGYVQPFTVTSTSKEQESNEECDDRQPITVSVSFSQEDVSSGTGNSHIQPFTVSVSPSKPAETVGGWLEKGGKNGRKSDDNGHLRHRAKLDTSS